MHIHNYLFVSSVCFLTSNGHLVTLRAGTSTRVPPCASTRGAGRSHPNEGTSMNHPLSRWRLRRDLALVSAVALAAAMMALTVSPASAAPAPPHVSIASEISHGAHASQPARTSADSRSSHACAAVIVVGHQSCLALKRDGLHPIAASASP